MRYWLKYELTDLEVISALIQKRSDLDRRLRELGEAAPPLTNPVGRRAAGVGWGGRAEKRRLQNSAQASFSMRRRREEV